MVFKHNDALLFSDPCLHHPAFSGTRITHMIDVGFFYVEMRPSKLVICGIIHWLGQILFLP